MANKEKMDHLLLDIRELEKLIAGMRDAEIYPVSFFSETFSLSHKIITELHLLEAEQLDMFRRQLEEHAQLMNTIPVPKAVPQPEPTEEIQAEEEVETVKIDIIIDEIRVEEVEEPAVEEAPSEPESDALPEIQQEEKTELPVDEPVVIKKQAVFLSEILEKKSLSDFRKAFSLNDRFRFRRELFGGDEEKMNKAVADLNEIHTYEDSISYLNQALKWNVEDEAVADFIALLEKRFL